MGFSALLFVAVSPTCSKACRSLYIRRNGAGSRRRAGSTAATVALSKDDLPPHCHCSCRALSPPKQLRTLQDPLGSKLTACCATRVSMQGHSISRPKSSNPRNPTTETEQQEYIIRETVFVGTLYFIMQMWVHRDFVGAIRHKCICGYGTGGITSEYSRNSKTGWF